MTLNITNLNPGAGLPIPKLGTLQFDVTWSPATPLPVLVGLTYENDSFETVWDGVGFLYPYTASVRTAISGGFHFAIRRTGAWPTPTPALTVREVEAFAQSSATHVVHTVNGTLVAGKINYLTAACTAMTLPALSAPAGYTQSTVAINETGVTVTLTRAGADTITGGTSSTTYELESTPGVVTLNDRAAAIWSAVPRL